MNSISKAQLYSYPHHNNHYKTNFQLFGFIFFGFQVIFMDFISQFLIAFNDGSCVVAVIADPLGPVLRDDPFHISGTASGTDFVHHNN